MCFSATASFSAAIVMAGVGVATLKICRSPQERFLGVVPFLFALQQLSEAFVWLSIRHSEWYPYQQLFTLSFLFFAWVVWPILIPLAFYRLEPLPQRHKSMRMLIGLGILSASYAFFNMLLKDPKPTVATFHIIYEVKPIYLHRVFFYPHQAFYTIATVLPMFLSSLKGVKLLALANFIALILCFMFFQYALPSTWCFFAAFISGLIYWIIRQHQKKSATLRH